jgi:hypothetical protein
MSSQVRDRPSEDSASRQDRAEDIVVEDIRRIEGDEFVASDGVTVYEIDATNESGEKRENITVIPSILFESTKDVQHRHEYGIVGKYTRALALEDDTARTEVLNAIDQKRRSVQEEISQLKSKDSRLMHTKSDLGGI